MNCEEFEKSGLDADRDESLSAAERTAAKEHAAGCARCAALQDSWTAGSEELRLYAAATSAAETPARVEMRLRQEFHTKHHAMKVRRFAGFTSAVLAAAAVLAAFVAWRDWQIAATRKSGGAELVQGVDTPTPQSQGGDAVDQGGAGEDLIASVSDFTPLPGIVTDDLSDRPVVRVRMQRASLQAWGLPVNEERAEEWIQVDLLVGDDGQPQAVRLSR